MASVIQICNLALLRCGGQTISSLDEQSREAQLCASFYEHCRDQMLQDFPWNFARKRATLALLTATPPTNWEYAYAAPSDCLQALRIVVPGTSIPRQSQAIAFSVGTISGVKAILTNQADAELEYTARVTEAALFTPLFASALAWLLASELCLPLMAKPDLANMTRAAYLGSMREAAAQDLNEGSSGPELAGDFLTERGVSL